jgi:hypothetical protein
MKKTIMKKRQQEINHNNNSLNENKIIMKINNHEQKIQS